MNIASPSASGIDSVTPGFEANLSALKWARYLPRRNEAAGTIFTQIDWHFLVAPECKIRRAWLDTELRGPLRKAHRLNSFHMLIKDWLARRPPQ